VAEGHCEAPYVKSRSQNWDPTSWKSHLKSFQVSVWKPRVWKSRPQSWDPKSWKPCLENHILKFPRPQSWDPKSWKPCLENHILKFPRPQSWDPKSWKPCPENHILKFPRSFWVLETRSANSRSPKTEDPTSWKSCPKNFQVWVLESHTVYVPKLKSHVLKNMSLKIPCLGFGEPPPVQANSKWPKIETIKNALFSVFKWVISGEWVVTGRIFHALPTQTNRHHHYCFYIN